MKVCVIGDVHGRDVWQKIDFSKYDKVIFMGDYFDPYMGNISYEDRLENFEKIVNLKGKEPEKYILLFGNHDLHYLLDDFFERYSRYDRVFAGQYPIQEMFKVGLEAGTLQIAYNLPGTKYVFVHAGISIRWYNCYVLERKGNNPEDLYPEVQDAEKLVSELNNLPMSVYKFQRASNDSYGFSPIQGPLWWRPETRFGNYCQDEEVLQGIIQVIGHTQKPYLVNYSNRVWMVDILGQGKYVELDTDTQTLEEVQINLPYETLQKLR